MSRFILFFAAFCLFAVSCSKTTDPEPLTPEEARRQLAAQSIPYSQGSFIQYARAGDLEAVRLFVAAGLDLNKGQGEDKTTALIAAASQGHLAVVRFLVESGAKNVLTVASNLEYYNRDWSAPGTALMAAAYSAHLDVVRYLVEHLSSDVEIEMEYALVWAAYRGHMDVVRYLYVEGASVNRSGVTALGVAACCEGHIEIARYLVETALMRAAERGHLEIVQYLVGQGADPLIVIKGYEDISALSLAEENGHAEVVGFLRDLL